VARAWFTFTVTGLDVTIDPTLSVTCSLNCHEPVVVRAPEEIELGEVHEPELPRLLKLPAPGACTSHWHV